MNGVWPYLRFIFEFFGSIILRFLLKYDCCGKICHWVVVRSRLKAMVLQEDLHYEVEGP